MSTQSLLHANFAGTLLHGDEHDVHQTNAGDAQRQRSHHGQEHLQRHGQNVKLRKLRHQIGHKNRVVVRRFEVVGGAQRLAQALFDDLVVAPIVEPDSIDIVRVFQIVHGVERHIDGPVAVVVVALLHLGAVHAHHREVNAVQPDGFTDRPSA